MIEKQSSYRQIMKATSLFGGVQVFQILISIIRSKFIAILLGPKGMGIAELLRSTIQMVSVLTNMGIGTSAVKNIAAANATKDQLQISTTVMVLRHLVWATGLIGLAVSFVLAPSLSQLTFGNDEFTIAFRWLSITLLFGQLAHGQMAILQGLRKLQFLAKANIVGSTIGLLITIPMYYMWGIDGIVPVMIVTSLISLVVSFYFSDKIRIQKIKVSKEITLKESKNMLGMGVMIGLSSLFTILEGYLVRIYISNTGDLSDVGLFAAGFAIIGTYVGMVFSAMGADYYPRLSEVISDKIKANNTVNQQAEIAVLILAPMIALFLIFVHWGIVLLYSSKFLPVTNMIHWAIMGVLFKAATWSMGFVFIAKGDSKWFFWNELFGISYFLVLNILGYKYFGLTGLGISFLVAYVLGFIQNLTITRILYDFRFERQFYKIFGIQLILGLICFSLVKLISTPWIYFLGLPFIFISGLYSINELDKRLDLKTLIKSYLINKKNK